MSAYIQGIDRGHTVFSNYAPSREAGGIVTSIAVSVRACSSVTLLSRGCPPTSVICHVQSQFFLNQSRRSLRLRLARTLRITNPLSSCQCRLLAGPFVTRWNTVSQCIASSVEAFSLFRVMMFCFVRYMVYFRTKLQQYVGLQRRHSV